MANALPKLVPGPAFHLEGDGHWDVQDLPRDVVQRAKYTGEIEIDGYPAVVFEMSGGDQWAQKAPGTPSPKGDEASAALSQMAARLVSDISCMGRRVVAKIEMEQSTIRAVRALLAELKTCRSALDKAVQHSRTLQNEPSLDWVNDQLESKQEDLSGLLSGIRDSVEYLTRTSLED